MARIDRIITRRTEAPRVVNKRQKLRAVRDRITGKVDYVRLPHHVAGSPWWRSRFADLVERRSDGRQTARKVA